MLGRPVEGKYEWSSIDKQMREGAGEEMSLGIVTEHLLGLIAKRVSDNDPGWYDPDGAYAAALPALDLPDTDVLRYGSFIQLRWEIDQKHLMDGEEAPRMLVYVPMAQDQTHHALIELESAGVIMQPGQQPPARNTRLAVVARNALKGVLGEGTAAHVEKQTEAGKLTLVDLDALADKGGEISKGVIALIFGTGNPQEVALSFLDNDRLDESITKKDAKGELAELLRHDLGFDVPDGEVLCDIRQRLASARPDDRSRFRIWPDCAVHSGLGSRRHNARYYCRMR